MVLSNSTADVVSTDEFIAQIVLRWQGLDPKPWTQLMAAGAGGVHTGSSHGKQGKALNLVARLNALLICQNIGLWYWRRRRNDTHGRLDGLPRQQLHSDCRQDHEQDQDGYVSYEPHALDTLKARLHDASVAQKKQHPDQTRGGRSSSDQSELPLNLEHSEGRSR